MDEHLREAKIVRKAEQRVGKEKIQFAVNLLALVERDLGSEEDSALRNIGPLIHKLGTNGKEDLAPAIRSIQRFKERLNLFIMQQTGLTSTELEAVDMEFASSTEKTLSRLDKELDLFNK